MVKGASDQNDDLEINTYYKFILSLKEDKEELVVLCDKIEKVNKF